MKKTLLTIASVLLLGATTFAQNTAFSEDFNGTVTGWSINDGDGDTNNWELIDFTGASNADFAAQAVVMASFSFDNDLGTPLTPDNYVISPEIDLSAYSGQSVSLSFKLGAVDAQYYKERVAVYIVEGTDLQTAIAAYSQPVFNKQCDANEAGKLATHVIDMNTFAGKSKVWIIFRHFDSTDEFMVAIDDVSVNVGLSAEELGVAEATVYPNPANDVVNFALNSNVASVKVVSLDGKVVASLENVNAAVGQVSLADAKPGMYVIEMTTVDGLKATNMFVKK